MVEQGTLISNGHYTKSHLWLYIHIKYDSPLKDSK